MENEQRPLGLHNLHYTPGSRHHRKIVGRGTGSGHGKTCGRGSNGQNARSGGGVRPGFEGGQTPLFKRLPKRGFTNINRREYAEVNLSDLKRFAPGSVITPSSLADVGLIDKKDKYVKILGKGDSPERTEVHAHKFSESAEKKIIAAGGKAEVIARVTTEVKGK